MDGTSHAQHRCQIGHAALFRDDFAVEFADEASGRHALIVGQAIEDIPELVFQPDAGHAALQTDRASSAFVALGMR